MIQICRQIILKIIFIVLFGSLATSAQGDWQFRVIVHKDVPVDTLTVKDLSKIFLKKKLHWEDEWAIEPVDLLESSRTRAWFSQSVHHKKVSKIKAYWQKQIFTGRAVPPPEKKTDREVLEYVQSHLGGIGYVSSRTSLKNYQVKTIVVIK